MEKKLLIFHGSENIVDNPKYGKGKIHNDYGRGFYCTEHIELAKEWAVTDIKDGYVNKYSLDTSGLKILDLGNERYNILNWVSILMENRTFDLGSDIALAARQYLLDNFYINTDGFDVIKGYRADDSYFSFAKDFLQNSIPVSRLKQVMKLGNLGEQICLKSQKAFSQIEFMGYEKVEGEEYFPKRKHRDYLAKQEYLNSRRTNNFGKDEVYILDIIRNEIKENDPRI